MEYRTSKFEPQVEEKAALEEIKVRDEDDDDESRSQIQDQAAPLIEFDLKSGDPLPEDPFLRDQETSQCTIRSLVVGCLIGLLVGAANLYISYKTGFSMDAGPFAVFAGFGVLRLMQKNLPPSLGGGFFGPKENVSIQSAANGANSGAGIFAAAIPAMFSLQLLSEPKAEFGRMAALGVVCAFFGTFFAIPLRKFYILRQRLVFPGACAEAMSIRTIHSSGKIARLQIRTLFLSFSAAFVWTVVRDYAPGVLREWHFFYWISLFAGPRVLAADNWGWGIIETTPCFFGVGMIVGLNVAMSFFLGCILAWGVVGPITVAAGLTAGIPGDHPGQVNYMGSKKGTPRYWLLWPGLLILMVSAFAEVGLQWRSIGLGVKIAASDIWNTIRRRPLSPESSVDDPALPKDQVPLWAWSSGLVGSIVVACVVLKVQFHVQVYNTILAVILGFMLACIGIQATGTTSINPVGPVAKFSQLVFGGVSRAQGHSLKEAQMANLMAGTLAGQAASHSADMVADFKIGHLLGATPKGQAIAQIVGTVVGIVPMTAAFLIYAVAYPCIITLDTTKCPFQMAAATAWQAVARAMTETESPIPPYSGITALVFGGVVVMTVLIRERLPTKYRPFVPNWGAIGLAWVIPGVAAEGYSVAMVGGAVFAYLVARFKPRTWQLYGYPVAAGLQAGEACAGLVLAALVLGNIDGGKKGNPIGCPFNEC